MSIFWTICPGGKRKTNIQTIHTDCFWKHGTHIFPCSIFVSYLKLIQVHIHKIYSLNFPKQHVLQMSILSINREFEIAVCTRFPIILEHNFIVIILCFSGWNAITSVILHMQCSNAYILELQLRNIYLMQDVSRNKKCCCCWKTTNHPLCDNSFRLSKNSPLYETFAFALRLFGSFMKMYKT